jgi:hypothetical protein
MMTQIQFKGQQILCLVLFSASSSLPTLLKYLRIHYLLVMTSASLTMCHRTAPGILAALGPENCQFFRVFDGPKTLQSGRRVLVP